MIWGLLLMAMAVMKLWPETAGARWLHRISVEQPLAFAGRFKRRHLIFATIGLAIIYSVSLAGMPHLATIAAVDVSAYVDAMITVWTVAALTRARGSWAGLKARLPRTMRRGQARSRARRRRALPMAQRRPANDDDADGAGVRAA